MQEKWHGIKFLLGWLGAAAGLGSRFQEGIGPSSEGFPQRLVVSPELVHHSQRELSALTDCAAHLGEKNFKDLQ